MVWKPNATLPLSHLGGIIPHVPSCLKNNGQKSCGDTLAARVCEGWPNAMAFQLLYSIC